MPVVVSGNTAQRGKAVRDPGHEMLAAKSFQGFGRRIVLDSFMSRTIEVEGLSKLQEALKLAS